MLRGQCEDPRNLCNNIISPTGVTILSVRLSKVRNCYPKIWRHGPFSSYSHKPPVDSPQLRP